MAMTEQQWAKFQNNFPQEDRISYADYLNAIGESAPTSTPTGDNTLRPGDQGNTPPPTTTSPPTTTTTAVTPPATGPGISFNPNQNLDRNFGDENITPPVIDNPGLGPDALKDAQLAAAAATKAAKKTAGPGEGKKAYIWDDTGEGSWVKPPAPGAEALYDWNDDTGWKLKVVTPQGEPQRPAGTPAAYIYDTATKTWVKPKAPGDETLYDWDNTKGWTLKTATGDPQRPKGTGLAYIYDPTTKTWIKPIKPEDDKANTYIWDDDKGWVKTPIKTVRTLVSTTYTGTGANRKKVSTYSDNTTETEDAPESGGTGGTVTGGGFTQLDIDKAVKAAQDAAAKTATDAATAASKTTARKNMIDVLYARFKNYGLETLAKKIESLAIDGATEDTITLQLQDSEEYKTRFKANDLRVKNDLKYLSPGEYLNLEDSYRQVLRAYGLKTFDNDAYVSQFIANDMSPTELSNRVVTAVQRVRNADPAVSKQLRDYYGIGQEDLVAYVLDPEQQFQKIERQVAASEIGVAAGRQGLTAGVTVAEQLAAQGVSQAEAQKGYATIADILPGAEKLSNIYGATQDTYAQSEGEQEVFNSLASAQRKRQKLSATEAGTFGASSGTSKGSFSTGYLNKQSSAGQF